MEKFQSEEMKMIYCCIKYLKKALDLDLSSYWVKKELLKSEYQDIVSSARSQRPMYNAEDTVLVTVMSQPEFRQKIEGKIDIEFSSRNGNIILKKNLWPTHYR